MSDCCGARSCMTMGGRVATAMRGRRPGGDLDVVGGIYGALTDLKSAAVAANVEMFPDAANLAAIARYVERGVFPWEKLRCRSM